MSLTTLKSPPATFVKYDDFKFHDADATNVGSVVAKPELCNSTIAQKAVLLRDDHLVLLIIDALLALHARFKKWRNHRRTLRALAELDEHQLRDIGLTRDGPIVAAGPRLLGHDKGYRPLAELDDGHRG
jgi:uncharacterized protein DUF1127